MLCDNQGPVIGLSYQLRFDSLIEHGRHLVDSVEANVEPFFKSTSHRLRWLSARRPVTLRCASLSLGGPDPIDERMLDACAALVGEGNALWISYPLGFSRSGEIDLGLTIPISFTQKNLELVSQRARMIAERCGCPVLIENAHSPIRLRGTLTGTSFLNALCSSSGCRLLVDLQALHADSVEHRFDATRWLDELDPRWIVAVRVAIPLDKPGRSSEVGLATQLSSLARLLQRVRPRAVILGAPRIDALAKIEQALTEVRHVIEQTSRHSTELA
jgi:uncharacterized protein (UPF0276 family)